MRAYTQTSRCYYDASLLFRCMDMLQIDCGKLRQDDPLLFRELQGVCSLCPRKQNCSQDLASGFSAVHWDKWWGVLPELRNADYDWSVAEMPSSDAALQ